MKPALEVAAHMFRPTLWEPKGTPVLGAEYTKGGGLVIATGPELHNRLGVPRRKRRVFVLRTYTAHPPHAPHEEWACNGFHWCKTKEEALALLAEMKERPY